MSRVASTPKLAGAVSGLGSLRTNAIKVVTLSQKGLFSGQPHRQWMMFDLASLAITPASLS